jgi:peptidoglycan/LPS O-acetylase OafA/YrhL
MVERLEPSSNGVLSPQLKGERVAVLDGFRALSIVLVMLSHAQWSPGFPVPLRRFLLPGAEGVHVFFVLSGYLITWLMLREEDQTGRVNLRNFYIRRTFRILPALLLYIAAIAAFDGWRGWKIPWIAYIHALTFTNGIVAFPSGGALLQHTWSLGVEEQFYFLWPLVFVRSSKRRRFQIAAAILIIQPFVRTVLHLLHWREYVHSSLGWADAIMWGCMAALAAKEFPVDVYRMVQYKPFRLRLVAVSVFVAIAACNGTGHLPFLTLPFGGTINSVCIAYLILSYVFGPSDLVSKVLSRGPFVQIGVLSYSLYLWQELFTVHEPQLQGSDNYFWKNFPMNILMSLLFASMSYFLIERPMIRWRRHLLVRPTVRSS